MIASVPSKARAFHTTAADSIFRILCAVHGLDNSIGMLKHFRWLMWLVTFPSMPVVIPLYFFHLNGKARAGGLADLASASGGLLYVCTNCYFLVKLHANRHIVQSLVQAQGRSPIYVFLPLCASSPFIVICFRRMLKATSLWIAVGHGCSILLETTFMTFFMLYFHIVGNLLDRHRKLSASTSEVGVNVDDVVFEKWDIREKTQMVNSVFAYVLALHYLQFFEVFLYECSSFFEPKMDIVERALQLPNFVLFVLELFHTARQGSMLAAHCSNSEREFWRRFRNRLNENTCHLPLSEILDILRFRKQSDALRVACFDSSIGNYFGFLSTAITWAAVILQFDYKVVHEIQSLAKNSAGNAT